MIFQYQVPLGVLDTQLCTQGMKFVCVLRNHMVPLLMQNGPFCILVIIVSHGVILFLNDIYKDAQVGLASIILDSSDEFCSQ